MNRERIAIATILGLGLLVVRPASAFEIAHWTFDHPVIGDHVRNAPFLDDVQGLDAVPVIQGGSSIRYAEPSPAGGVSSLHLANAGTSNENGSFLQVADNATLTGHDRLAISVWVKPEEIKLAQIVRKTDGGVGYQLYLLGDGRYGFRLEDNSGQSATVLTPPVSAGEWHHLEAIWDSVVSPPRLVLRLDGQESVVSPIPDLVLEDTSNPLSIGALYRSASSNGQFFNGRIDDLRIATGSEGFTNSLGMRMIQIPGGTFTMGSTGGDFDEVPLRDVTVSSFHMAQREVTNAQFEEFMAEHSVYRSRFGGVFSADEHPVTFVSWEEATAFCEWLSAREGRTYRLPTEAEWEYAARAGTTTAFATGDSLPSEHARGPVLTGTGQPNPWGLQEMHGNVEEWCLDWHGPYPDQAETNPVGRESGLFRVTRGGSMNTDDYYLRSANRSGSFPEDRDIHIGFRVVAAEHPDTSPLPAVPRGQFFNEVSQEIPADLAVGPDPSEPYFEGPLTFVKIPDGSRGPLYSEHNHNPAIEVADNGDLIAIWYSNQTDGAGVLEAGRDISVAASRLRYGADDWEDATYFFGAPDRNDHGPLLWKDPDGRLVWVNGYGSISWANMSTLISFSEDHGATWTPVREISSRGGQSGPINTLIPLSTGRLLLPLDWHGHTQLFHSDTNAETWERPARYAPVPNFAPGNSGNLVWGIHATMSELANGDILAFGRISDSNIDIMPRNISRDGGLTWEYSHSEFPDISYGQRAVMSRLAEGPLVFFSFTDSRPGQTPLRTMPMLDHDGNEIDGFGLYAALSWDDGETWPVRKLISAIRAGEPARQFDGGAWTGRFVMSATRAEPKGYLSMAQGHDGVIHLVSSKLHYRFNLKWLVQNSEYDFSDISREGIVLW